MSFAMMSNEIVKKKNYRYGLTFDPSDFKANSEVIYAKNTNWSMFMKAYILVFEIWFSSEPMFYLKSNLKLLFNFKKSKKINSKSDNFIL